MSSLRDSDPIPVVLFAYARPDHLARVLSGLRENAVPLICAFADGAKGRDDAPRVAETRALLRAIDWCELRLVERTENLGLGRNVLAGVTTVAAAHPAFVVWEDDLIAVPGTYAWMCAALRHYAGAPRVMSVTAWTHPRVTPPDTAAAPYFDGRAECWVWGTWSSRWTGMPGETAREKLAALVARGGRGDAYGADLPAMARDEKRKNIWAVRWLSHHLQHGGLCLRPPWSMVEHIGFDPQATNAGNAAGWANPPLRPAPPIPARWPDAVEHPACRALWQTAAAIPPRPFGARVKRVVRRLVPAGWLAPIERRYFRVRWEGDYPTWSAAESACGGYANPSIVERVVSATRAVRSGRGVYERDGVVFHEPPPPWAGLAAVRELASRAGRPLTVLDFGGALGTLYFQVKNELDANLRWAVVEQPAFVAAGREFEGDGLEFHPTVAAASAAGAPDFIVLGSVLPYLPSPLSTQAELLAVGARHVFVERTGFTTAGRARLTVQHVPRSIYRASYPCWFLDRAEFLRCFAPGYRVVDEQREPIATPAGLEFRTFHFARVSG
jgi:putative methyltransferase (TIGR04325 family)